MGIGGRVELGKLLWRFVRIVEIGLLVCEE